MTWRVAKCASETPPPKPTRDLDPAAYADQVGQEYLATCHAETRKTLAQYFTPTSVALFMASLTRRVEEGMSLLDPGAGAGILSCALIQLLSLSSRKPKAISLTAYEVDEKLIPYLTRTLGYAAHWARKRHVRLVYRILNKDFVLEHAHTFHATGSLLQPSREQFDVVISNPPYFKISHASPYASAAATFIPNIYALFMAAAATLLKPKGQLIFITPRSYTAGPYFQTFRARFLARVSPVALHVFESRTKAFDRDKILQEHIILSAVNALPRAGAMVTLSSSEGLDDLSHSRQQRVPLSALIDLQSREKMLHLPTTAEAVRLKHHLQTWQHNLETLGLKSSTGPVVAFRSKALLLQHPTQPSAPLLWLQNVKPMQVQWPAKTRKPQFLAISPASPSLYVPNSNYVLVRRFSAKEAKRRLVAAPYLQQVFQAVVVGLENHLNYVYRPGGNLSREEVYGLSALFNSRLLDTYFRTLNGNTQVNATDLMHMPLPPLPVIQKIGRRVLTTAAYAPEQVDGVVENHLTVALIGFRGLTHL